MLIKINTVALPVAPSSYAVTILDLDDEETTSRSASGLLTRDRITVKRKVSIGFDLIRWSEAAIILQMLSPQYVDVYYADPLTGTYQTKTFYVGDRPSTVAIDLGDGEIWWSGVAFTLTER